MLVKGFALTDVGKKRDHNEDFCLSDPELGLYIVCDGMGGHAAGEVANEYAATIVHKELKANKKALAGYAQNPTMEMRNKIKDFIDAVINKATLEIYNLAQKDPDKNGMGTTLAMILFCGQNAFIAHVGDSRVYLIRQNKVNQLTMDHSFVNELLKEGMITKEEAKNHPKRNVITRAIGLQEVVRADVLHIDTLPDDQFLICSDGLSGYMKKKEIWEVMKTTTPEEINQKLIDTANQRGGKDNITAITIKVESDNDDSTQVIRNHSLTARKIELLSQIPLFCELNFQQVAKIIELVKVKNYRAKDIIIREGKKGEEMYVILQGEAGVYKGQQKINHLKSGQFFGEMSLIDEAPRFASIMALTPARLLILSKKDLFKALWKDADMASKIYWFFLQNLNKRVREKENELLQMKAAKSA